MSIYVTDNYNSGTGVTSFFITGNSNGDVIEPTISSTIYKSGIFPREFSDSDPTSVLIPHNLGVIPKRITFNASYLKPGEASAINSVGVFDSSGNISKCVFANTISASETYAILINTSDNALYQRAIVSVDETNMILNWTSGNSGIFGNIFILYSAEG